MHLNMKLLGLPTTWAWRCAAVSTAFKRQPVPKVKGHQISQQIIQYLFHSSTTAELNLTWDCFALLERKSGVCVGAHKLTLGIAEVL